MGPMTDFTRSAQRKAPVIVRFSREQRETLKAAAAARGATVQDYVAGLVLADAARAIGNTPTDQPEDLARAS